MVTSPPDGWNTPTSPDSSHSWPVGTGVRVLERVRTRARQTPEVHPPPNMTDPIWGRLPLGIIEDLRRWMSEP